MVNYCWQWDLHHELALSSACLQDHVFNQVGILHEHLTLFASLFSHFDSALEITLVFLLKDYVEPGALFLDVGVVQPVDGEHLVLGVVRLNHDLLEFGLAIREVPLGDG